jgi:hypothetical protein
VDAENFAAELFRAGAGVEPPKPKRWEIIALPQDGTKPLYEADKVNKIVHLFLHEGQMKAWNSDKRFSFMFAGTQGGKTSFLPWILAREILADETGGDSIAATATYDLFKLKFLPMLREVFEDVLGIARYWAGDQILELRNPKTGEFHAERSSDNMWGRIILRSAASKGGLESATAKRAILDEMGQDEFTFGAWQAIRRRLSLARGRVWGGTTLYNLGWLKLQIYDPWEKKRLPNTEIIQFSSIINPAFSKEEFQEARDSMQDHSFQMQYEGKFGRPAAAIFKAFIDKQKNEGGHRIKSFPIPQSWPRKQAVDPGIINTSKLWVAYDPVENFHYVYRSTMADRKPATEHAKDDLDLERLNSEHVVLRAIGAVSEKYWREDYKNAGAHGVVAPDTNDVEEGIDRVVTLLKGHRIYFFDDDEGVMELIREILEYAREVDDIGQATDKIKDKSKFHRVDTLRYLAIQLVGKKKNFNVETRQDKYA